MVVTPYSVNYKTIKRMKNTVSILLIAGIILLINLLSNQFFFRLDLTADKQYTLSKATKDILKSLNDPVTVTAYFSENLEPSIAKVKEDLQDMLTEYATHSKGYVDYKFINPDDDAIKQEAMQAGVSPGYDQCERKRRIQTTTSLYGRDHGYG